MNRFRANPRLLAPLIAGLSMLGPFSIDAMFPAFHTMSADLGVSAVAVQQTLSVYLAAFAVMSLLHGPLSDAYGRRGVIQFALLLYVVASVGCVFAPNLQILLICRALQGASSGAGLIVGRAVIRDRFEGADATRLMSRVTLIFGIAPAIAPIIGGAILGIASWRWIYGALVLFGVALWAMTLLALPETHPRGRRTRFALRPLLQTYAAVVGDGRFLLLGFAAASNFAAMFIYIASAPVIVLDYFHLNERQFAWLFIPIISCMMAGALLAGRLAGRVRPWRTVGWAYALMGGGLAVNLLLSATLPPVAPWSILPVAFTAIGMSLAFPTLTLLMIDRFPQVRGAAASVQTAISLLINTLISGLIAPLAAVSMSALSWTAAVFIGSGFVLWRCYCWRSAESA